MGTEKRMYEPGQTIKEMAKAIITENRITLVPARTAWMVEGLSGETYSVQLFKRADFRPRCSCPATTTCSYVLAAMESIDYPKLSKKEPNATLFEKKSRKRSDKKSGYKQSRRKEVDISSKKRRSLANVRNFSLSEACILINQLYAILLIT